jgi:hypothetical protein
MCTLESISQDMIVLQFPSTRKPMPTEMHGADRAEYCPLSVLWHHLDKG